MAATRSSDYFNRVNYVGTWRGRSAANNITWEMFPEKTESTNYVEDPDAMYLFNRDMLRYTGPDAPTFEYEQIHMPTRTSTYNFTTTILVAI